jgi:hypothetical protein
MKLRSGVGGPAPGHPSTAYGRLPLIEGESHASSSATMTVPYYISKDKSDMRSIKRGWGPFSSHEECLSRIIRPMIARAPGISGPTANSFRNNDQLSNSARLFDETVGGHE